MNNNQKQSNGFFNGFLWGALLGAGVVFLVGTKRGKKLFKILTEEGFEGVSELGDIIEDLSEAESYRDESVNEKEEPVVTEAQQPQGFKTDTRRFFRRKPTV